MLSPKPWQPDLVLRAGLWLLISVASGSLLISWLFPAAASNPGGAPELGAVLVGVLAFHGVAAVLIWRLLREHRLSWREAFGLRSSSLLRTVVLTTTVTLLTLPVAIGLGHLSALLLQQFRMTPVPQQAVRAVEASTTVPEQIVLGVFAVVVAPVVEECVFRGILYPTIKQLGYPRLALWGTALFFGMVHANAMSLVPLTFFALVLTWLYEVTDNLLAPILAHSLFNGLNFLLLVSALRFAPVPGP